MEGFSRKKYIVFKDEFPDDTMQLNSLNVGCIYKRVSDWGFVKFHNINISEIIEYEEFNCYIKDLNFDEFHQFYSGKRPLLIERYLKRTSQKAILIEREDPEVAYIPLKVKLEKIIMLNGNSYIVF